MILIEKSIARHNAKIDKFYKKFIIVHYQGGELQYYCYPLKGYTKEQIENLLKNDPLYSMLFSKNGNINN